jgi:hypothetical protein
MSESLPYSGVEIVDVMRNAVVAQACMSKPCRSSAIVRVAGRHDRLVQGGQEHTHHQAAEDRQDLAMGEVGGRSGSIRDAARRRCCDARVTHTFSRDVAAVSRRSSASTELLNSVKRSAKAVIRSGGQSLSAVLSSACRTSCSC